MIAGSAIVYPNVILGDGVVIEDFCIIGAPYQGGKDNEVTIIGNNALIRSHTVIYAGNRIADNFQTGNKVNIRELNRIGNNVSIGTLSVIEHHVLIEDDVRVHSQAFIPEFTTIRQSAWIGPNVVMTNAKYPQSRNAKTHLQGPTIGQHARIGANATILPGLVLEERCLIGAGSVVTKNVGKAQIVKGNPALTIGEVDY